MTSFGALQKQCGWARGGIISVVSRGQTREPLGITLLSVENSAREAHSFHRACVVYFDCDEADCMRQDCLYNAEAYRIVGAACGRAIVGLLPAIRIRVACMYADCHRGSMLVDVAVVPAGSAQSGLRRNRSVTREISGASSCIAA